MKIQDIIETRLDELKVNKTSFDTILDDDTIKMGFECEVITNYRKPEELAFEGMDWDDAEQYMHKHNGGYPTFQDEYEEWKEKENEDGNYNDTKQDFIDSEFNGDTQQTINYFSIITQSPDNVGHAIAETHNQIADDMEQTLGGTVVALDSYHGREKVPSAWYVEPDGSLDGGQYVPAEIVSPVFSLNDGLDNLKKFFGYMDDNAWTTNNSTGLHVSMSIEGKNFDDYDYLKMMIFYEERFVATVFDRLNNEYAQRLQTRLLDAIPDNNRTVAPKVEETLKLLKGLSKHFAETFKKKYSIHNRGNGVFEFRAMGGEDYHEKYDQIRKLTVSMANILKMGCDDQAYAREYFLKVYALLAGKFGDEKRNFDLPMELNSFSDYFKRKPTLAKLSVDDPLKFVNEIMGLTSGKSVSDLQNRQIKAYVLRNKITQEDAKGLETFLQRYQRLCRIMGWNSADE